MWEAIRLKRAVASITGSLSFILVLSINNGMQENNGKNVSFLIFPHKRISAGFQIRCQEEKWVLFFHGKSLFLNIKEK